MRAVMAGVLWRPVFDPDFAAEIVTAKEQLARALDAHDANPHLRNANADQRMDILRRQFRELRNTTGALDPDLDGSKAEGARGGQA